VGRRLGGFFTGSASILPALPVNIYVKLVRLGLKEDLWWD
jgi:hypothetical protein